MVSYNPLNPVHLSRLRRSIEQSRTSMVPFMDRRTEAVREYVGQNYSDNGSRGPVPVNLIALLVNVLIRNLGSKTPRTYIRPRHDYKRLASSAWDFELALNATLDRIQFGKSLRTCILDAIFSNGFMKVALYVYGSAELHGMKVQGYHPFADPVDLDNMVLDLSSKRWDTQGFIGDKYDLPYEAVMESPLFDKQAKLDLSPSEQTSIDPDTGHDRVESIGADIPVGEEPFREKLRVWDIWLPDDQLIVTMTADDDRKPLRISEWNGPQRGPYHHLGYIDVPNSILKTSPVNNLLDLHILANELYSKARDQGIDQKTILGYMAEAADDAEAIINSGDRSAIRLQHPDKIREFNFNGVDQVTLAFALEVMQRFSYFAGNLDVLGGLGAQADTAKQEELISSSASAQIQDMQAITATFVKECCESVGSLLWHDPLIEIPLSRGPEGLESMGITSEYKWKPEHRIGDFLRYNIEINPHSMRDKTPQQQLSTIMSFLGTVFAPNAQFAIQQGVGINFEGLSRLWARLADMDEVEEVLTFDGPPMADRREMVGQPLPKPAVTKRTYERINRPGMTNNGHSQVMQQLLAGSRLQPTQQAAMGRPNG